MRNGIVVLKKTVFIAALLMLSAPQFVQAQGRDFAKDLLGDLIESQFRRRSRNQPASPRTNLQPGQRRSAQPATPAQARTTEMRELRPIVREMANQASTLSQALRRDAPDSNGVRRLLPGAYQFEANVTALDRQLNGISDHRMADQLCRTVAANWETLKFDLGRCRELSRTSRQAAARLSELEGNFLTALHMGQQFDTSQLTREAYMICAHLRDLRDDMHYLQVDAQTRRQLDAQMYRHEHELEHFARLVSRNGAFQTCRDEYKDVYSDWGKMRSTLSKYDDRHVSRLSQRIQDAHRDMHHMLRMELGVDQNMVAQYVRQVDRDMRAMFSNITLAHMLQNPQHSAMTTAASATFQEIQRLGKVIRAQQGQQSVANAWVRTSESWNVLAAHLENSQMSPEVAQLALHVADGLESLRESVGISISFDPRALQSSAAEITSDAQHLQRLIRRWHARPGRHDRNVAAHASNLVKNCQQLETTMRTRPDNRRYQQQMLEAVITDWHEIRPEIAACTTIERDSLDEISMTITRELIRLRTALE